MAVDQLLYGRVETDYSPRRFPGFQLIRRSAGVTPAEVKAVEAAVAGFAPAPDAPAAPRLQYFRVDKRIVLTHSVGVRTEEANYRKYIDRDGRGGGFICHALLLGVEDFAEFNCQPFRLIDGYLTGNCVNSLPKLIDFLAGHPDEVCEGVRLPAQSAIEPHESRVQLTSDEKLNLAFLLQAVRQSAHPGVVIEGGPSAVADLLRVILARSAKVASGEQLWFLRQCLTFDTISPKAEQKGLFWAVGAPTRLRPDSRRVWIDGTADPVVIGSVAPPSSRYQAAWVEWAKPNLGGERMVELLPDILRLSAVYDDGAPLGSDAPPSREACRAFYQAFPADVADDAVVRAGAGLPPTLAAGLGTLVRLAVEEGYAPWWREKAPDTATVARWLAAWVRVEQPELGAKDWKFLREYGEKAGEWPLAFWATHMLGSGWSLFGDGGAREASRAVGAMTPAQFAVAVEWLGRPIPPAKYFHPDHAAALAAAAARAPLASGELSELIELLIQNGRAADLGPLADRVDDLPAGAVRRVAHLSRSAADVPEAFRRAVDQALAPVLPPYPELAGT